MQSYGGFGTYVGLRPNAVKHDLVEMLTIALLASLTGLTSCNAFALFAKHKLEFLRGFMRLEGGAPSHDAFTDLFNALDPEQMAAALTEFAKTLLALLPDDQVAIDGKVLRRSFKDASERTALHLVQAFAPGAGLVLGQAEVDGKSNETTAIPSLLEILDLVGRTVTADAMHTRREVSAQIVEKGGDYVLPVKRNQKSLHEDIQVRFSDAEAVKKMLVLPDVGGGHGCIEERIATVSHDVGWLQERHGWPGLKAIGMIETVRERKERSGRPGRQDRSVRYFIMSAEITPERLLKLTRSHWKIENSLHWVLDVVMNEDQLRNRTLNGPECLAALRRIALNIVRLMDDKNTLKGRMQIAAMSDEYLLGLLVNAIGKF